MKKNRDRENANKNKIKKTINFDSNENVDKNDKKISMSLIFVKKNANVSKRLKIIKVIFVKNEFYFSLFFHCFV